MKTSTPKSVHFYEKLGYLFYSIAAADHSVTNAEIELLKKIIREEWVPLEDTEDEFGTDTAFQIEVVFDWLRSEKYSSERAFRKFESFKELNNHYFDEEINKKIIKTAEAMALSFAKINKEESSLLWKLNTVLWK